MATSSAALHTKQRVKTCLSLDKVIVCILLVMIWGASTAPFFIFYFPEKLQSADLENGTTLNKTMDENTMDENLANTANLSGNAGNSCYHSHFYYDESRNYCVPDCHTWRSYSAPVTVVLDAGIITSCCIGTLCTILVIIISILRKNIVLKFPAVMVFYMAISSLIFYTSLLVGHIERYKLFCISRNLEDTLKSSTPYCIWSGAMGNYIFLQVVIWWLSHIISLYFMVFYPVKAKNFMNSRKVHCLHFAVVLLGLAAPTLSPLVTILSSTDQDDPQRFGYRVLRYPPLECVNIKGNIWFYALATPFNLIVTTGLTLLILIFWKLYKQKLVGKFQLKTAEKKILVSLCYFTLLQINLTSTTTYLGKNLREYSIKLFSFFLCARYSDDCDKPSLQKVYNPAFMLIFYGLNACLPIFLLVYVIDFEKLKQYITTKKGGTARNNSTTWASNKL